MEAVEITGDILQQKWRWPRLPGVAAPLEEYRMVVGVTLVDPHPAIPFVGDICEMWVERRPQASEKVGKRIFKVAVLAPAEAMPRHVNMAAEVAFVRIEGRDGAALFRREELLQDSAAIAIKLACEGLPVVGRDPRLCGRNRRGGRGGRRAGFHTAASFSINARL